MRFEDVIKHLVIKRYPFTEKLFAKYPNLDIYEREELNLAIAETFNSLKHKVGILEKGKFGKFIEETPEIVDDVYSGNIFLSELLCKSPGSYYCICGGGQCAENPEKPCYTEVKDLDGKYACYESNAYRFERRLGISDGQPWKKTHSYCASPSVFFNTGANVVEFQITHTPDTNWTVQSVVFGGAYSYYASATCCTSCPTDAKGPSNVYCAPVFYFPYTKDLYANVTYVIVLQIKW